MPVASIDVDPLTYQAASAVFGRDLAGHLDGLWVRLDHGLTGTEAMAGEDSGGQQWAAAYDKLAPLAASTILDLSRSCRALANLLELTGFNNGMAEAHSDPTRAVPMPADRTTYDTYLEPAGGSCLPVPCAAGGSGKYPAGWSLIRSVIGWEWPDGHQNKLHRAASAWVATAEGLDDATVYVDQALTAISAQQSPEVEYAATLCGQMRGNLHGTAAACRDLASRSTKLAESLDRVHTNAKTAMEVLVIASATTQIAGIALSTVTCGLAEGGAQALDAGEVKIVATEVGGYIATFAAEAADAAVMLVNSAGEVVDVARALRPILAAELSPAATEVVAGLPELSGNEPKALTVLRTDAARTTAKSGPTLRADLSGNQLRNFDRFVKKLPASADNPVISTSVDGTLTFSARVPGRVPGSYATYTKVIDRNGMTTSYVKTTVAPDGTVVHVKVKFP